MTHQLKILIREINSTLGTNYDLIKFDTLEEKKVLQTLIDILSHFEAGEHIDVSESDPETISINVLQMLSNIKYKPPGTVDSSEYRIKLLTGDRATITGILQWIFNNKEQVKKTAYLAKYLKLSPVPADIQGNSNIQELLEMHRTLSEEFKEAHKRLRIMEKSTANVTEMMNDIKEMSIERDIVIKRLESVQSSLFNIPEKDALVSISKNLRIQLERAATLETQKADQAEQFKKASEQLQRYLNVFHGQTMIPKTGEDVLKQLQDEIQLSNYLVGEKLPRDIANSQKELSIMQEVVGMNATRRDLQLAQAKLEDTKMEIESLVRQKMNTLDSQTDKLNPFRQQATSIRRKKETTAEKFQQLTQKLRERETQLAELQYQVKQLLGENILRGEEMKKYVSKLKSRSVIYKKQRSKLAAHKIEVAILSRTLDVLINADPSVEMALLHHSKEKFDAKIKSEQQSDTPKINDIDELSQNVIKMSKKLIEVKRDILPLSEKLLPIREEFNICQQEYEQKKRAYDSVTMNINAQMEPLQNKINELKEKLSEKENEWKVLRQQIDKTLSIEEILKDESSYDHLRSPRRPSKLQQLQKNIRVLESNIEELKSEQQRMSERRNMVEEQTEMWNNVVLLLKSKLHSRQAMSKKQKQEKVTITQNTQMLTLQ